MVNSRLKLLGWELPASIEVTAGQRAPVVSVYDTIWVEHRDDLEHETAAE